MEDIINLLAPKNLPLELGELGTVTEAELIIPGVYDTILEFLETGLAGAAGFCTQEPVESWPLCC